MFVRRIVKVHLREADLLPSGLALLTELALLTSALSTYHVRVILSVQQPAFRQFTNIQ